MKGEFLAFFVYYPLAILFLISGVYFFYGEPPKNLAEFLGNYFSLRNASQLFGILVVCYFGHVTYGWLKIRNRRTALDEHKPDNAKTS